MVASKKTIKCFISASSRSSAEMMRSVLSEINISAMRIDEIAPTEYLLPGSIIRKMSEADFVCGILDERNASDDNVFLELGIAIGLSRPIFLVANFHYGLPFTLQAFPHVRATPSDSDAIRFHLSAFLTNMNSATRAALAQPVRHRASKRFVRRNESGRFIEALRDATERELTDVVARALRTNNANVTTEPALRSDARPDIIAWFENAPGDFGSPTIIEIKRTSSRHAAERGVEQVRKYMDIADARSGILVVTLDQDEILVRIADRRFIFIISLRVLLELTNTGRLIDKLVETRNHAIHGGD